MFSFFKKTNKLENLQKQYKLLLEEAYKLSSVDRKRSDLKTAEANDLLKEIEKLSNNAH